jgi:quercetin dioxygenase-like cupin family protein
MNSIRPIVTGHDMDGKAIFINDNSFEPIVIPTGDAAMATVWTTASVLADCNDETDGKMRETGTIPKRGSVISIVNMLPRASSPMHRTSSIDYGIIMSGKIELELENGIFKAINQGEIIVQRGIIHKWRNTSKTEICRIVFVLPEAKAFEFDSKSLPEVMEH